MNAAARTGRLVLQMQVSLDGRMAAADPGLRWQVWDWGDPWTWDDALKRDFNAAFETVQGIVLSRKMADDGYLDHWGQAAQRADNDPSYAFARRVVDVEKLVVTRTLRRSRWARTNVVSGDLAGAIRTWKRRSNGDLIAFGGIELAASLVAAGVVDEYQLYVNPTVVGEGRSIFDGHHGLRGTLIGSTAYPCGVVVNRYSPPGDM